MSTDDVSAQAIRTRIDAPPSWLGSPAHARWLEMHTDDLISFASASSIEAGFGYLDGEGDLRGGAAAITGEAELWITCRMTHSYSLGAMLGRPGCAVLVDHGLLALRESFADREYGGWFSKVTPQGPTAPIKEAYAHAFVLLATSSATLAGRPGAAELLEQAKAVHSERFWSEEEGMAVESWDAAWTQCEDYRGVNANMHTVESYLAVADATGEDVWRQRALRILRRVMGYAKDFSWRIPEHFSTTWEPLPEYNTDDRAHPFRPYGATVGHWFEWARLALHARAAELAHGTAAEDVAWLHESAVALFDAGVAEGWAVDGEDGFVYTVDFAGEPVVRDRMHWVVTEALGAAAALWRASLDDGVAPTHPSVARYAELYQTWWDYAQVAMLDGSGSWIHQLDERNEPADTVWPGKPDIYHAIQASLIPRLPLWPALASAVKAGLLDR
ncbi:AGE family epimerase/isomerase [Serinibacter salmoneus]|uniref:Mannose/cellobiose epimerase-like protein (N-acyl-D-glucosamine 2-epimerase family) n=1 Tax=Serinibacter salmoneus TaxID=556530 RepID=A0A2A9D3P0_9MICO|nr:AGE family epimerase/isomerase [Serinibacter salmoneus]PFG20956.1 mannose/cellobiose epimerase-like protein (N-acyl-D-glucosamine 2-epimerase family) [Serinibacter salmoneus]